MYNCKDNKNAYTFHWMYSGTSLIRSPTGLGKSDLNGEVTLHCL